MSITGMPSVTHTMSPTPASAASKIASAANRAGTKTRDASAPVSAAASATVSKTGTPSTDSPAFPGVTPETTRVPYPLLRKAWNDPSLPVIPWTTTFVSRSRRMATSGRLLRELHGRPCGLQHRGGGDDSLVPGLRQDPPPLLRVGPVEPDHDGDMGVHPLQGVQDPLGHQVAPGDPPEDVDQHR